MSIEMEVYTPPPELRHWIDDAVTFIRNAQSHSPYWSKELLDRHAKIAKPDTVQEDAELLKILQHAEGKCHITGREPNTFSRPITKGEETLVLRITERDRARLAQALATWD